METITKYKAFDGCEFTDAEACKEHEANLTEAAEIMSALPKRPDGCDFANGAGFLRHDKDTLLAARNRLCEFAKRYTTHHWLQETIAGGFDIHPSYVGRLLDDCAPGFLSRHWSRFMCIDHELREWGQPYFASHPDGAQQIQLN